MREYLLEKWGRKCAYCGKSNVPLEVEHIIPKSRGGTNRVSNLTLACHMCNNKKGNRTAWEYGYPEIQTTARQSLKDAAAVNTTRWELWRRLTALGLPVQCGTGGRTKYNRARLELPKTHWIDAACVGDMVDLFIPAGMSPLFIQAKGHGSRQMCRMNCYGFPRTGPKSARRVFGFKTGDQVTAKVPAGKYAGRHTGRVAVRASGRFNIQADDGIIQSISYKHCRLIQASDGYSYSYKPQKGGAASTAH